MGMAHLILGCLGFLGMQLIIGCLGFLGMFEGLVEGGRGRGEGGEREGRVISFTRI